MTDRHENLPYVLSNFEYPVLEYVLYGDAKKLGDCIDYAVSEKGLDH